MNIIDPGENAFNSLIDYILDKQYKITNILLTHAHFDHIGAISDILKLFPNAKIYVHKDDYKMLSDPYLNLSAYISKNKDSLLNINYPNINLLKDNDILDLDKIKVRVIHTPFHTSGSVCYYLKDNNILFSGDTLFKGSIGRADFPSGDESNINSSLKKLSKLDDKTLIYPGHGESSILKNEIANNPRLWKSL